MNANVEQGIHIGIDRHSAVRRALGYHFLDRHMLSARDVFDHYDKLSRIRALTLQESCALERAIKELDVGPMPRWTDEETARLVELREQGLSLLAIARQMGRSKNSVYKRWARVNGNG